ncbi:MAG: hypothetical protein IJO51_01530, partial [Clostridia bacterium]|nr:hypothetical protein [Clostridia bacterium]
MDRFAHHTFVRKAVCTAIEKLTFKWILHHNQFFSASAANTQWDVFTLEQIMTEGAFWRKEQIQQPVKQ